MSMKLYVGNLSFQTSSFELEELFATVGTVESATVVEDRETGRSRGFGFVTFKNDTDGDRAQSEMNGQELDGRTIKVDFATSQGRPGGGGGGGGGFGGGRGGGGGGPRGGGFGGGPRHRDRW